MKEGSLEHKKAVCKDMYSAVRKVKLDDLKATVEKHGLRVQQVWRAPKGEGFKCCAARFIVEGEEVLVVAFRSTFGGDEWLEYSDKYFKRRLLPHDGEEPGTDRKVLTIWNETLDEVRDVFLRYSIFQFSRWSGGAIFSCTVSKMTRKQTKQKKTGKYHTRYC